MKKTLYLDDLNDAIAKIKSAEYLLSSALMDNLNGKIKSADLDRLNQLEDRIRLYRFRLEEYASRAVDD